MKRRKRVGAILLQSYLVKGKAQILAIGSNKNIYHFAETENLISNNGGIVMEGKVTVVGRTKILRARAGEIHRLRLQDWQAGSGGLEWSAAGASGSGRNIENEFFEKR